MLLVYKDGIIDATKNLIFENINKMLLDLRHRFAGLSFFVPFSTRFIDLWIRNAEHLQPFTQTTEASSRIHGRYFLEKGKVPFNLALCTGKINKYFYCAKI